MEIVFCFMKPNLSILCMILFLLAHISSKWSYWLHHSMQRP